MTLKAIVWDDGKLSILDQLLLPHESKYIDITGVKDGWTAIFKMQVRGAPAIAIVGALSVAIEIKKKNHVEKLDLLNDIHTHFECLINARPTAVNIKIAAQKINHLAEELSRNDEIGIDLMKDRIISEIVDMLEKDVADNMSIGDHGASEILANKGPEDKVKILTHCNTGSLATAGYGTALGVIRSIFSQGKLERAYCTETRPYNQGSRLTAYELVHDGIPSTLICDDMVAALMKTASISAVVVGADRVAANGDTANKIGTYQIAVLAKYHNVPFYIAAPFTTIDFSTDNGDLIKIEERPHLEMTDVGGIRIAAEGIDCWNPAFDVTPASLITGIITEKGVFNPNELSKIHDNH